MKILNRDEITTFLNAAKDQKYRVLFSLAIFSGARQGELLGLKWPDILWADKQIFIQRSYNNGRFYDTKTKGSIRKIDVGPAMLKKLKECYRSGDWPVHLVNLILFFPQSMAIRSTITIW